MRGYRIMAGTGNMDYTQETMGQYLRSTVIFGGYTNAARMLYTRNAVIQHLWFSDAARDAIVA